MAYAPTRETVRSNEFDPALFWPFVEARSHIDHGFELGIELPHEIAAKCIAVETKYQDYRSKRSELCKAARTDNPIGRVGSDDSITAHAEHRVDSWSDNELEQLDEKLDDMEHGVESLLASTRRFCFLSARQVDDWRGEAVQPDLQAAAGSLSDLGLSWREEELPDGVRVIDPRSMMHQFGQLEVVAEDPEYDETSLSTCSTRPHGETAEEPTLLRKLQRKLGQLSIQQERLSDLCIDHEEEFVDRNFRLDQGQDVQPSDKVFERRFQKQSQKIMHKIDSLVARVKYLERRCVDAGIPIPKHHLLPEQDISQEEASPPSSQQQRPLEEDILQDASKAEALPNSRPPSPGASDRVSDWMQALAL